MPTILRAIVINGATENRRISFIGQPGATCQRLVINRISPDLTVMGVSGNLRSEDFPPGNFICGSGESGAVQFAALAALITGFHGALPVWHAPIADYWPPAAGPSHSLSNSRAPRRILPMA